MSYQYIETLFDEAVKRYQLTFVFPLPKLCQLTSKARATR